MLCKGEQAARREGRETCAKCDTSLVRGQMGERLPQRHSCRCVGRHQTESTHCEQQRNRQAHIQGGQPAIRLHKHGEHESHKPAQPKGRPSREGRRNEQWWQFQPFLQPQRPKTGYLTQRQRNTV